MAQDDGTLRERYLAAIEGEIIAARVRLARARERMGDDASDRARDSVAVVQDALASLQAERDRIHAGDNFDTDGARAMLDRRRRS